MTSPVEAETEVPRRPPPGGRLGIFGGTFDPPHVAHVVAACWTRQALDLDEVWFVPANRPWQKVGTRTVTPAGTLSTRGANVSNAVTPASTSASHTSCARTAGTAITPTDAPVRATVRASSSIG